LLSAVPGVTDETVARTFEPYVIEDFDADSPQWLKAVHRVEEKLRRPTPPWERWLTGDGKRTTAQV
jgi:hypothetical protein